MALIRIALFSSSVGKDSDYFSKLNRVENGNWVTDVYSDNPGDSENHYLQFESKNRKNPYDLTIYVVCNHKADSVLFYYICKYPGVVFLNDLNLENFLNAISFSPNDPWGTRWVTGSVFGEWADTIAKLEESGIDNSSIYLKANLAKAIAQRSAGIVVKDFEDSRTFPNDDCIPPVSVFEPQLSQDEFFEAFKRSLDLWLFRMIQARQTIEAIQHPLHNFRDSVEKRFAQDYGQFDKQAVYCLNNHLKELLTQELK